MLGTCSLLPCVAAVRRVPLSTGPLLGRGLRRCLLPQAATTARASARQFVRLSVRVLSSVHASIGLMQPQPGAALETSCTYDCKTVNVRTLPGLVT